MVGFVLKNHAGGDSWNNIYILLNGSKEAQEVEIPEGNYRVVACDGVINEGGLSTHTGGKILVEGQSALIFHD